MMTVTPATELSDEAVVDHARRLVAFLEGASPNDPGDLVTDVDGAEVVLSVNEAGQVAFSGLPAHLTLDGAMELARVAGLLKGAGLVVAR